MSMLHGVHWGLWFRWNSCNIVCVLRLCPHCSITNCTNRAATAIFFLTVLKAGNHRLRVRGIGNFWELLYLTVLAMYRGTWSSLCVCLFFLSSPLVIKRAVTLDWGLVKAGQNTPALTADSLEESRQRIEHGNTNCAKDENAMGERTGPIVNSDCSKFTEEASTTGLLRVDRAS